MTSLRQLPPSADERVDYLLLSAAEREGIHEWCKTHGLDPRYTPVAASIEYDPIFDEWLVEQFYRDPVTGRLRLNEAGDDVRRIVVRRCWRAPLPWPTCASLLDQDGEQR